MVSNSEINTSGNANVESFCIIWVLELVRLLTFSRYLFLHLHFPSGEYERISISTWELDSEGAGSHDDC